MSSPIGTRLAQRETVGKGLPCGDTWIAAEGRNPIHVIRQQKPVPVDGSFLVHFVCCVNNGFIAFFKAKNGGWDATIDRDFFDAFSCDIHRLAFDNQIIFDGFGVSWGCCRYYPRKRHHP